MPRRLTLTCAVALAALTLTACGGSPAAAPDPKHPSWAVVSTIVCPEDANGSVADHKVTCTDDKGRALEAAFYEQPVDLDRRVSTFQCANNVKSVAGKDWMVPAVTDPDKVSKLLDAGGINLC